MRLCDRNSIPVKDVSMFGLQKLYIVIAQRKKKNFLKIGRQIYSQFGFHELGKLLHWEFWRYFSGIEKTN